MNKEIEMLYKTLKAKDKIINEQVLEIARLNNLKTAIDEGQEIIVELQQKIDKANEILSNILVIKRSDGNYGAAKNTRKKEVYKAICMLNEILETPCRTNYNLLGDKEQDIEFDILKALNTDLDDDVEMG